MLYYFRIGELSILLFSVAKCFCGNLVLRFCNEITESSDLSKQSMRPPTHSLTPPLLLSLSLYSPLSVSLGMAALIGLLGLTELPVALCAIVLANREAS